MFYAGRFNHYQMLEVSLKARGILFSALKAMLNRFWRFKEGKLGCRNYVSVLQKCLNDVSKHDSRSFDAEKHVQLARNDDVEDLTCLEL
jgi:hypothetical protein